MVVLVREYPAEYPRCSLRRNLPNIHLGQRLVIVISPEKIGVEKHGRKK